MCGQFTVVIFGLLNEVGVVHVFHMLRVLVLINIVRSVVSAEDEDDQRLHLCAGAARFVCSELPPPRLSLSAHIDSGQHKYA